MDQTIKITSSVPFNPPKSKPQLPSEIEDVLESVWEYFGYMSASDLRELTHHIGPYGSCYRDGVQNIELPNNDIYEAWASFLEAGAAQQHQPQQAADKATLKKLLNTPTEQHPDFNVDQLMNDYSAFMELREHTNP